MSASIYHPRPMTRTEKAYLMRAWDIGYSGSAIARGLGTSPKRVLKIAADLGLPKRPAHGPRLDQSLPKLKPFWRPPEQQAEPEPEPKLGPPPAGNFALWNSTLPGLARKGLVPWDKLRG